MKKKIYLSGPMAGHEADEITERFKAWERALRLSLGDEWAVVNPSDLFPGTYTDAFDYDDLLAIDKVILTTCDAIFMMPGWEDSNGAKVEKELAERMCITVHGWADPEEGSFYTSKQWAQIRKAALDSVREPEQQKINKLNIVQRGRKNVLN